MKQEYFIEVGGKSKGPFTIEELKKLDFTNETLIWKEGWETWQKIIEIEELKGFVKIQSSSKIIPPPLPILSKEKGSKNNIQLLSRGSALKRQIFQLYLSKKWQLVKSALTANKQLILITVSIATISSLLIIYLLGGFEFLKLKDATKNDDELINKRTTNSTSFTDDSIRDDSINRDLIKNFMIGKGTTLPLKNTLSLEDMPPEDKTYINILNWGTNDKVNVHTIQNKISKNETYFQIIVSYYFFVDKVKEYDPNLMLSSFYHANSWLLVDNEGNYYKPLLSFTTNKDSTYTLYYDGTKLSLKQRPSKVKDRSRVTDTINFKVPLSFSPSMLIYKIQLFPPTIVSAAYIFSNN